MLNSGFTLGRIFGIRVQMHWTLVLLAVLITWSLYAGWFPRVLEASPAVRILLGLAGALGLFVSILLHELSHALVARRFAMPVERITLFLFGGVAHMEDEPPTPKAEFLMAIAGPLMSLILALLGLGALTIAGSAQAPSWVLALLAYLVSINLTIAVFNMLPGFPLDGGRVLRAAIWAVNKDIVFATRVSSLVGQTFGVALIAFGLIAVFVAGSFGGLWTVLVGGLVIQFARQAYVALLVKQALRGAAVRHFMDPDPVMLKPESSVGALMRTPPRLSDQLVYPVARDDRSLVGLVDLRRTQGVPPIEWESHAIQEFAEPLSAAIQIAPDTDAERALRKMNEAGSTELMVVENNRLLGVLSIHSLARQIQLFLAGPRRPLPVA